MKRSLATRLWPLFFRRVAARPNFLRRPSAAEPRATMDPYDAALQSSCVQHDTAVMYNISCYRLGRSYICQSHNKMLGWPRLPRSRTLRATSIGKPCAPRHHETTSAGFEGVGGAGGERGEGDSIHHPPRHEPHRREPTKSLQGIWSVAPQGIPQGISRGTPQRITREFYEMTRGIYQRNLPGNFGWNSQGNFLGNFQGISENE